MKRAPIIPKTSVTIQNETPEISPAAPMVDSLMSRVGAMTKGHSIALPVCGREVRFALEIVPAGSVQEKTTVWQGNERDQDLLTEESLNDLIPSFNASGQQTPAFGRRVSGIIEVADGSRRRKTAIVTSREYRVLVGELDDEQMDALCKLGNEYRPTSAYERGRRYAMRLEKEFNGSISALSESENISRKIITRCIHTARLPHELLALFQHPGELSARAGESLYKNFINKEKLLLKKVAELAERKRSGFCFDADEIIDFIKKINDSAVRSGSPLTQKQFLPGALVKYRGDKVTISLDRSRLQDDLVSKLEAILDDARKAYRTDSTQITSDT